jgi:hypothetical protein
MEEWYTTIAKRDWFITRIRNALHYARLTPEQCEQLTAQGYIRAAIKLHCGVRVYYLALPGVLEKFDLPRCKRCCKMFKIPYGNGSPGNDPVCRKILRLPKGGDDETLE